MLSMWAMATLKMSGTSPSVVDGVEGFVAPDGVRFLDAGDRKEYPPPVGLFIAKPTPGELPGGCRGVGGTIDE